MTLLIENSTPAERIRGCVFAERFESAQKVAENNGVISGTPQIDFGATLDGTNDYISYDLSGTEYNSAELSQVIEFWPHFDTDEDASRYLIFGPDSGDVNIHKQNNANNNVLSIKLGNTLIADIAEAAYTSYWVTNGRNYYNQYAGGS